MKKDTVAIIAAVVVAVAIILVACFALADNKPDDPPLGPGGKPPPRLTPTKFVGRGAGNGLDAGALGLDQASSQAFHRDQTSRLAGKSKENLTAARRARLASARGVDQFDGSADLGTGAGPGFGWAPNELDKKTPHGGWIDAQSYGYKKCMDGCSGGACDSLCADAGILAAIHG